MNFTNVMRLNDRMNSVVFGNLIEISLHLEKKKKRVLNL